MLLIKARLRPCRAFASASSPWRLTSTLLSFTAMVVRFGKVQSSFPFGPSIETFRSLTSTLTFAGIATGIFPIRDINPLSDKTDQLAADVFLLGIVARHHPLGR